MPNNSLQFYEFGPFRIDVGERFLLLDGEVVPLTLKAFDLLLTMVERSGHVFEKDELLQKVWPDSFVEEANLSRYVHDLREVLGDSAGEPKYIETVPRRGYRFVASVRIVGDEGLDLLLAERTRTHVVIEEVKESETVETNRLLEESKSLTRAGERQSRFTWNPLTLGAAAIIIGATILGIGGGVYWWKSHTANPAPDKLVVKAIAVLPFKPLAPESRDESLELGMADTLITRLGSVREIIVRPTSAVRKYTDLQQDAVEAGRELSVDSVLDGTIQREGEQIRVTVRLLSVKDGSQFWAGKFDEKFTDIFALQDAISEKVVEALALKLSGEEQSGLAKRYTEKTEAYELYLKGRYFWWRFSPADHQKAAQYFNQAIAKDPTYALAYSGLGDTYGASATNSWIAPSEGYPKAMAAVKKALELDETLAEAHCTLGGLTMFYLLDWANAEREYKRAIELKPNYSATYELYSYFLSANGRLTEAIEMAKRGLEADPLSVPLSNDVGQAYYQARRYDEAIKQHQKTNELDPNQNGTYAALGFAYDQKGMYAEAIAAYQKGIEVSERTPSFLAAMGHAYAASGRRDEALKILSELKQMSRKKYVGPYDLAILYTGLGEKDKAFEQLDKAIEERSGWVIYLNMEPFFDPLRSDPRFAELLRRVGLPQQ